jgi:phosphoglucosamine mutase
MSPEGLGRARNRGATIAVCSPGRDSSSLSGAMGRLFGTDGIRGVAGEDLTTELAYALGRAAVLALGNEVHGRPTFVVGRDTRASGEMLEKALVSGISAAGGDALLAGVQTTPAVAFLTVDLGATSGVVISASHNPPEDNGIKFFGSTGYKLPDKVEDEIEQLLADGARDSVGDPGTSRPLEAAHHRYLEHLREAADAPLVGWRIVIDCANGSASEVGAEALRQLGADVHAIFDRPDGTNINDGCGALHPDVAAGHVVRLGADAGVSLDGDADRVLFSDASGNVVDGDQVVAALALSLHEEGRLAGDRIVATVMSNLGLMQAMEAAGIDVRRTAVGDRYVLEEMLSSGAILGGEPSGHVILAEHATTGDGLLAAVKFLSLAAKQGTTVESLAASMQRFPQVLENIPVRDRNALEDADQVWATVRDAENQLGRTGRVLVRASGTEPLVRVMVEAESEEDARRHARRIAECVRSVLG